MQVPNATEAIIFTAIRLLRAALAAVFALCVWNAAQAKAEVVETCPAGIQLMGENP